MGIKRRRECLESCKKMMNEGGEGMKHTKEEIINALRIIKEECEGSSCTECPFGDNKFKGNTCCRIKRINPACWVLVEEESNWKALKG